MVLGFVGVVELLSFLTIGAAQGKKLVLFGTPIDVDGAMPWAGRRRAACCSAASGCSFEARAFHRVWENLTDDLKDARAMTALSLAATCARISAPTEIIRGVTLDIAQGERHASSDRTVRARPRCST